MPRAQLPLELIRAIIRESIPGYYLACGLRICDYNERCRLLRRYCLVNSVFRQMAREELWHKLLIRGGNQNEWLTRVELEAHSISRLLTRKIRLWGADAVVFNKLLALTPNLVELFAQGAIGVPSDFNLIHFNHLKRT